MINTEKLDAEILITMYNKKSNEFNDELYAIKIFRNEYYIVLKYLPFGFYLLDTNIFRFERISLCKYKIHVKELNLEKLKYYNLNEIEKIIVTCITEHQNNYLNKYLPQTLRNKLLEII